MGRTKGEERKKGFGSHGLKHTAQTGRQVTHIRIAYVCLSVRSVDLAACVGWSVGWEQRLRKRAARQEMKEGGKQQQKEREG
jgi:hypothetical protein